ncbi:MAG TPA: HAD family hydrolase [Solirubrobacterales bacterium]|nr:HAD family hydrolase [Solirubrobacterales bacterium]
MRSALLFDLDDTLIIEEPAATAAFIATAQTAAARHGIDSALLAAKARLRARELWYSAPSHEYCMRVGISSWEGLWCRFEGEGSDVRALRDWSPTYRQETWRLALADLGVNDSQLSQELAERFGIERRARHEVFADAAVSLSQLVGSYALALVTNGAACLQREKLAASGLGNYFDAVVVSADLGVAKPDALVFGHALSLLNVDADHAVMVGDSISKDVDGALAAGLRAIWVNRDGCRATPNRPDLTEISTLSDLPRKLTDFC